MPSRICVSCGKVSVIRTPRWKELDDGPFVCSKSCVFDWIWSRGGMWSHKGMVKVVPERASASWSSKLQKFFRSDYEKYFAEEATRKGFLYEFEEYRFLLAGRVIYTPDFYFPHASCFVEVKGPWGISAKGKVQKFREEFSHIPLLVVPWLLHEEFYPKEANE